MKVICTICARGGSQGVKNKNILNLCGKPLIAHSIIQAKQSGLFDVIAVSSDSDKILKVAKKWGADLLIERSAELATATAAKLPVIQHAVLTAEQITSTVFDKVIDLDATSPLRLVSDITEAFKLFMQNKEAENLITAFPSRHSPYFNMVELNQHGFVTLTKSLAKPIIRRQDSPLCYDMNASIYIWKRAELLKNAVVITEKTMLYVMPEERSVDIDSPLDLQLVKLLAKTRQDLK